MTYSTWHSIIFLFRMDDELEDDLSSEDEGCDSEDNKSNSVPESDHSNTSECTSDNKITENVLRNEEKTDVRIVANAGNDDPKDTKDLEQSEKNRESNGIEETIERC